MRKTHVSSEADQGIETAASAQMRVAVGSKSGVMNTVASDGAKELGSMVFTKRFFVLYVVTYGERKPLSNRRRL